MGTNFYKIKAEKGRAVEGQHIGKRSAAGKYCIDCDLTLNIQGDYFVHRSSKYMPDKSNLYPTLFPEHLKSNTIKQGLDGLLQHINEFNKEWFLRCPECGKEVKTITYSFSWAIPPYELYNENIMDNSNRSQKTIMDEYGQTFTGNEFLEILNNCKIKFYDSIGDEFC